ncbi:MMPL family transporter [Streptomyces hiroshimensis]|uniref:Membrane protein n=1 Tax=Streptomyces hiroshimensis TaxID=66424 RepID=A0ABQ2YH19_9ACTN|nr:MMPL family transporter [Streptomyces hiroshimensis]GGX83835.1 putative membrane protein [Streptomyces hiroshimensis]
MFRRVGRFAVHRPWLTIAGWIIAAVALSLLAPGLKSTTDETEFLPSHYESVQAGKLQEKAFPKTEQPSAIVVFQRSDGGKLTAADRADVAKVTSGLNDKHRKGVARIETNPQAVSPNGEIALANLIAVNKNAQDQTLPNAVKDLRQDAKGLLDGTHLKAGFTGQAATNLDAQESSGDTDSMIMSATLLLIIILLLVIFRSPLIALMPVLIIALVFAVALGLIGTAAELGGLKADNSISAILIVVLFGVGTDYILFLLFRYREELRAGQQPKEALTNAVARVGETIASAAGAVIVAFLALLLSTMGMMRAMGPSLAIAVGVTLVAALTLVPAVFSLLGTKAFWPSKAWKKRPRNRLSNGLGALVARRPAAIATLSAAVLAVLAIGTFSFKAEFDTDSQLPQKLESVQAMKDLQRGFSAGQSDPAMVYVESPGGTALDKGALGTYKKELAGVNGVGAVSDPVVSPDGTVAQYSVVLKYRPTEDKAIELAGGTLRDTAHKAAPDGSKAYVGGTSAVLADVENAVSHDYKLVFPIAGLAIMIILGLLLRSIVAPLYLMVSVALGFGATLGSTVWLFQDLQHKNGLLFMLPVIVYLFVVAIGTDYNILMVARLREEVRRGVPAREAIHTAVARSAPTIASAAIILAGTFGVLLLADNSMLQQMGFAVAFGILLTAFVMAMLLVPTITSLLGHKAWWPGHQDAPRPDPATEALPYGEPGRQLGAGEEVRR